MPTPLLWVAGAAAIAALFKWSLTSKEKTDDPATVRENVHNNRNRDRNPKPGADDTKSSRRKSSLGLNKRIQQLESQGNEILTHLKRVHSVRDDNIGDGISGEPVSAVKDVGKTKRPLEKEPETDG